MIANCITIDDVKAENGGLRLMKNLTWEYDALPHALICGGTGGGKTYFLLTIIEALLQTNAQLYILDPKNADLADLGTVMDNMYHTKEDMIECVNAFYEGMVARGEEMKHNPDYKTGESYAYLALPPCFLVGNNQMYHAGNPIGYTDLTSAYWQQHIICAGRIKQ